MNPARTRIPPVLLAIGSLLGAPGAGAAIVSLSNPAPVVRVDTLVVFDLTIAYEPGEPTTLFSFGARLDVTGPGSVLLDSIEPVPELDFFGTAGTGAFIDSSPSVLGVKGTVNVLSPPVVGYPGTLLASYTFEFPAEGEYSLTPREFNTLGPTEEIFVSGDGTVLDPQVSFTPVSVTVVPEPRVVFLALLAGAGACLTRRRAGSPRSARRA